MTIANAIIAKRLRSPEAIAEAAAQLRHAGFTRCDGCSTWHDEGMRAEAYGSADDPRCPACGRDESMIGRQDAAS